MSTSTPAAPLLACLCAAWCRLCDGYGPVFDTAVAVLQRQWPALQARWIDIEDEADLVGDLDIETFPTLVLLHGGSLRFAGVLTPQPEVLQRVLAHALAQADAGEPAATFGADFEAFAQRLHRVTSHAAPPAP
ncbi:MAG: thioredoxin family protein [Rubrivivax sp.]